jgi:hypothetical protein
MAFFWACRYNYTWNTSTQFILPYVYYCVYVTWLQYLPIVFYTCTSLSVFCKQMKIYKFLFILVAHTTPFNSVSTFCQVPSTATVRSTGYSLHSKASFTVSLDCFVLSQIYCTVYWEDVLGKLIRAHKGLHVFQAFRLLKPYIISITTLIALRRAKCLFDTANYTH